MGFIGEELNTITGLDTKPSSNDVLQKIKSISKLENIPEYLTLMESLTQVTNIIDNNDMNLEDIKKYVGFSYGFVIGYIFLWLAKYSVKEEFYADMTLIFLVIIRIMKDQSISLERVYDEKIRKMIVDECKKYSFEFFKQNTIDFENLLSNYVKLLTNLIVKSIETANDQKIKEEN